MICHVVYRSDHTGNGVITEHPPQRAGIVRNVRHISGNGRIPEVDFYFRAGSFSDGEHSFTCYGLNPLTFGD